MDMDKIIREEWFKDHVATLTKHGNLEVLEWFRPKDNCYGIRYVFDGCMMYICGDLGEAVFQLTWKAGVHNFNVMLGYFKEKMQAYSGDKIGFDSDEAIKRLREWLKELKAEGTKYDHDEMRDLFDLARECHNRDQWGYRLQERSDFLSDLDPDYWEWIYDVGNVCPPAIRAYLIGLQMASKQLEKAGE